VKLVALSLMAAGGLWAQSAENVLVVVNARDALSRRVGAYYVHARQVPLKNVCRIDAPPAETIGRADYEKLVEAPIARCLSSARLVEKILYIVTAQGVPLRVSGAGMEGAAVDSELTLLYSKLAGRSFPLAGAVPNPFYQRIKAAFTHRSFPIYLVTRLAGYDSADIKAIVDRSLAARNRGKFVIDLKSSASDEGNNWLRLAASELPIDRVVLDESDKVLYDQRNVIAYAAWGSNDFNRHRRLTGFQWLPGAIVTEFVSTNGRTFLRPPADWNISTWKPADRLRWFAGSPQTLTADYIHEGATGCSGHVDEPYLSQTPRPDYLLPAYFRGRNLAESYYVSIPGLSWQNIVVGDPLCRLK
jgi:uncharacterized protein (TIGR03790 family)